jgi:hypothetical protein
MGDEVRKVTPGGGTAGLDPMASMQSQSMCAGSVQQWCFLGSGFGQALHLAPWLCHAHFF